MGMAVVTLKKGEGRLLKSGGMWIFDNEIDTVMGNFENGDIVLVHDFDGYPMGRGFINTNSKITVRLMTRDENVDINEELLEKRVRDAWEYRKKVVDTGCCRLIFAEADFLPGIVVDKFSDILVVQSLALGIDRFKETIVELLRKNPVFCPSFTSTSYFTPFSSICTSVGNSGPIKPLTISIPSCLRTFTSLLS